MKPAGTKRDAFSDRFAETMVARPLWYVLGLLGMTLTAVAMVIGNFQIEGDIAKALKGDSAAYVAFQQFEDRFGAPSQDEVYMVQTEDFGADGALASVEDLIVEFTLDSAVLGVMSLFSLPDPDGVAPSFLTRPDMAGLSAAEQLDAAYARIPMAQQVLSQDRSTLLISVIPDRTMSQSQRIEQFDAVLATADTQLTVTSIGLSALQRSIADGLIDDLLFLLPMIILICLVVSFAVFRSWRAALICTIPAVLGLIWTFGAVAMLGISFNAVLAVAPAVLVVLGIADSIHLFNAIVRRYEAEPMNRAIVSGLRETIPAIALATLTTIIAFASLRIVGSPTLADLALVGSMGLALALVAVLVTVPVGCHLLLKRADTVRRPAEFAPVSRLATALLRYRRRVAVLGILLLAGLFAIQSQSVAGFSLTNHVPFSSNIRSALASLEDKGLGSDQMYVVVDLTDQSPEFSEADRARMRDVSRALYGDPGALPDRLDTVPLDNAVARRVFGAERTAVALPVSAGLGNTWSDTLSQAAALRADLDAAGLGEVSTITGYSVMSSIEIPDLVRQLRISFYATVGVVTLLAAVMLRSVPLALMSLLPNLIPILGVEAALVIGGLPLTLTGAIGLTVAFGIAVDDTIHLLNRLRLARADLGHPTRAQVTEAVVHIVPPVMVSSLILFAGLGMTAFSTLPSAALFGQLVIGALALALLADLFLFPSLLAWNDKEEKDP